MPAENGQEESSSLALGAQCLPCCSGMLNQGGKCIKACSVGHPTKFPLGITLGLCRLLRWCLQRRWAGCRTCILQNRQRDGCTSAGSGVQVQQLHGTSSSLWFPTSAASWEILLGAFIFQRVFHSKRVCKCEFKSVISFPLSSKHLFHHFKWFLNGCNALDLPAEITSVLSSKPEFLSPLALCSLQIIQWEFIWKEVVGHKWSKMLTAGVPTQSLLMWKAGSQI